MSRSRAMQPWMKPGVLVGGLFPLTVLIWRGYRGELGAEPVAAVLNQLGYLALTLLAATLLCTPVKIITGWTWSMRLRRMLGLLAFLYACLHFLTYIVVDQGLNFGRVTEDITKRKFILVGFLTLLVMIPLAITSTKKMVRRMGFARWKLLHRLTYVAGGLSVIHFVWRVKIDLREPLIFATIVGGGLLLRAAHALQTRAKKQRPRQATS